MQEFLVDRAGEFGMQPIFYVHLSGKENERLLMEY
jgi:hypothetical protein